MIDGDDQCHVIPINNWSQDEHLIKGSVTYNMTNGLQNLLVNRTHFQNFTSTKKPQLFSESLKQK